MTTMTYGPNSPAIYTARRSSSNRFVFVELRDYGNDNVLILISVDGSEMWIRKYQVDDLIRSLKEVCGD